MRRQAGLRLTVAVLLVSAIGLSAAQAEGKLEAHYVASVAGIPIGSGTWMIDIGESRYVAAANGSTTGLLRIFIGGQGTSAARGAILGGRLVPSTYAATISTLDSSSTARLTLSDGNVKSADVEPPVDKNPERVPLTRAHEQGVLDPMTATLLRVHGNGNPLKAEACDRTLPIFDGRLRYDLALAYKRMDAVHAEKGYSGPTVVCSVTFSPLAGHIPSRTVLKYLAKQTDIEVWLVPISGTRVLVPFRAEGPTPIGKAVLQATQFVATPNPAQAAAEKTK